MARRLHLHVGMPKCASTSLQAFFVEHRVALLSQGIDYPDLGTGAAGNLTGYVLSKRPPNMRRKVNGNSSNEFFAAAEQCLTEALSNTQAKTVVLSSEALSHPTQKVDVRWLVDRFDDVVIHLILRPRATFLVSAYGQAIRANKQLIDLETFLEDHLVNEGAKFANQLAYWQSFAGKDAVRTHFLSPRFPHIILQFLTEIGCDLDATKTLPYSRNIGLSAFVVCAAVYAKEVIGRNTGLSHEEVIRRAKEFDRSPELSLLTPEIAQAIDTKFEKDTDELLQLQSVISREDIETDPFHLPFPSISVEGVKALKEFQMFAESLRQ